MHEHAHISISADRPRLDDFLAVAEQEQLEVGLRLWVGAIEVGLVGISAGRVIFAELPGTQGDEALRLLASLPDAKVAPERWVAQTPNVQAPWRTLLSGRERAGGDRRERLAATRRALRGYSVVTDLRVVESDQPASDASRGVTTLVSESAIDAYLIGDFERARRLFEASVRLKSNNSVARANLEVLRLRQLDDEQFEGFGGAHE